MDLERIIQDSLMCFIQTHIPAADVSGMDEVVFSYITSVLEELGSAELAEENFDMDTFVEMMEAYIPGFAEINRGSVCEMMFALSERLSEVRSKAWLKGHSLKELLQPKGLAAGVAGSTEADLMAIMGAGGDVKDGVQLLLEVFPACTLSQAQKALAMALGSLEEAVQLLVEEKVEPGEGPGGPSVKETVSSRRAPKSEELKRFILQKYMMVDSEEDQKTHRPVPPKEAPKKLIRYIDNQVVSTKGERFMNVKKPESEEMKRTYISLKPARKYKFH